MGIKTVVTATSTATISDADTIVVAEAGGSQKVNILSTATNVKLSADIETVNLTGNLADYKFVNTPGTGIQVQTVDSVVVATLPSLNQAVAVAFANGSTSLAQSATTGSVTLGGQAVTATAAAITSTSMGAAFTATSISTSTDVISLTVRQDSIPGTAGNDTFDGIIVDNSNTLQSGDKIDGGQGTDTLRADIGNSQKFAVTAETKSVERVVLRAQAVSTDSTDNNTASTKQVQIDAQRMPGVNYWENSNSRADLLIEDVRILPAQITKDITIAMVETDPGHVDFGFYFDQYSLRAQTSSSSTLTLELADTRSLAIGGPALKANPYSGFSFLVGGVTQSVTSQAIDDAQTYPELLTAVQAAVAANPALAGITVSLGANVTRTDTISGQAVQVTPLILSNSGTAALASVTTGSAWLAQTGVPASSGLHTYMSNHGTISTDKVTSKVILDDVGRGSTGGDLVIGGLSVGDTSTSYGVERFEIEVRDNSKLQTINSTNNTLQEVTIKNGVTTSSNFAYVTNVKDSGNLTVNGNVPTVLNNSSVDLNLASTGSSTALEGSTIDAALPGSGAQHNAYGFSDVRLIDGSAMIGKLELTAEITTRSVAKYMNVIDTQANPTLDALNGFGTGSIANFDYKGGNGNDTMVIDINSDVAGSRSTLVSGREDFTFSVNGGAGDDAITLRVVHAADNGNDQHWYNNQDLNNNITVFGGDGNDTIRTPGAGDIRIEAGTGNDTVYTDNTGFQTVNAKGFAGLGNANSTFATGNIKGAWVFNTLDQTTLFNTTPVSTNYGATARNVGDLRSDFNDSYQFYNSKVTVTFKGIPAVTTTVTGTNFKTTDLELNQAIKNAINNDAVLKKLLVAEDGPASTLVVKSLIDGAMVTTNLDIAVTTGFATATDLPASQLTVIGAAYGLTAAASTAANVHSAMQTAFQLFASNGDYQTALANDGAANITGAASITSSDNVVLPGTGNDVIVLGTTVGTTVAASSNETVVIERNFGNDTIVNFAPTGTGYDVFDFTALFTPSATAVTFPGASFTTDRSINVGTPVTSSSITEAQAVASLFNANNVAAQEHVYVVANAHNVGSVYTVVDAAGANNSVATLQGTIDLADHVTSAWALLTDPNFVNSAAANYNLKNGPTTLNGSTVVSGSTGSTGSTGPTSTNISSTSLTGTATAGADTFNIASGSYTATIAGFNTGDKLAFFTGAILNIVTDTNQTDGIQVYTADNGANIITTITLTGLTAAQDGALFNATNGFTGVFGASSISNQ